MIDKKYIKDIIVLLMVIMLPMQAIAADKYVNSTNGVNMRKLYNTSASILHKLKCGEKVEEISRVITGFDEWSKVKYGDDIGYIMTKYLSYDDIDDGLEYLGNWHITAYTHTGSCCANGSYPTAGYTVACNSLDFGTQIYIEGIGYRTVEDRGPGSLGSSWADVFMDSYNECVQFGSQYLDVYLVKENDD